MNFSYINVSLHNVYLPKSWEDSRMVSTIILCGGPAKQLMWIANENTLSACQQNNMQRQNRKHHFYILTTVKLNCNIVNILHRTMIQFQFCLFNSILTTYALQCSKAKISTIEILKHYKKKTLEVYCHCLSLRLGM